MHRNKFVYGLLLVALLAASAAAQSKLSSPKDHFGFNIGNTKPTLKNSIKSPTG
jgi:hypothetical protein